MVSAVFVAMTSYSLLCLLPLLTSVLSLPAADLLGYEHLRYGQTDHVHPSHEQDAVKPQAHQAGDQTASNGANLSVKESATECALFLCIRLLKLDLHSKCNNKTQNRGSDLCFLQGWICRQFHLSMVDQQQECQVKALGNKNYNQRNQFPLFVISR